MQQSRNNRLGPFGLGTGTSHNDQPRSASKAFGSGFGSGASAWNGDIWSSGGAIGSGMKSGLQENGRAQSQSSGPCGAFGHILMFSKKTSFSHLAPPKQ